MMKTQKHRHGVSPSEYYRVKDFIESHPRMSREATGKMFDYSASVITDIALTNGFEDYARKNEERHTRKYGPSPIVVDSSTLVVPNDIATVIEAPHPPILLDDAIEMIITRLDKIIDAQYKLLDAWNRA